MIYSEQENHEDAVVNFEAALKINPNNQKSKEILQATRDYMAARKNYLVDAEKRSKLSDDFLQQGNQQMGAKNWDAAISVYTKCVEFRLLPLSGRGLRRAQTIRRRDHGFLFDSPV
jgi:tetratricopeptide (TPR) repeat protein